MDFNKYDAICELWAVENRKEYQKMTHEMAQELTPNNKEECKARTVQELHDAMMKTRDLESCDDIDAYYYEI